MSAVYPRYYRKRKLLRHIKIVIVLLLMLVTLLTVFMMRNASAVIVSVGEAAISSYTTVAVSKAAEQTLSGVGSYNSIMTVRRDDDGNITDLIANYAAINTLSRGMAYNTQAILNGLASRGIDIPAGAFTGIDALSGTGFKINIKTISVSTVECSFTSSFKTAGINQTLHSLYLQVITDVKIVLPSRTVSVDATNEVLVCENIIVGNIPDYILGGSWLNNGTLVPQSD